MRALVGFFSLLLAGAVVVGVLLGNSQLLNPSMHRAKVDRIDAENEALREQTEHQRQEHELELKAYEARVATRQKLQTPMIITGLVAGSIAALSVAGSVAYYLIMKAQALNGATGPKKHPESDQALPLVERANVSPWRATRDGLLAYCCDFYLHADGSIVFYPRGISPDVARFYRSLLHKAGVLNRPDEIGSAWTLHARITSLDCIRARISQQVFDCALAEQARD